MIFTSSLEASQWKPSFTFFRVAGCDHHTSGKAMVGDSPRLSDRLQTIHTLHTAIDQSLVSHSVQDCTLHLSMALQAAKRLFAPGSLAYVGLLARTA